MVYYSSFITYLRDITIITFYISGKKGTRGTHIDTNAPVGAAYYTLFDDHPTSNSLLQPIALAESLILGPGKREEGYKTHP